MTKNETKERDVSDQLDEFLKGYIEAAIFENEYIDNKYSVKDIDAATMAKMLADCQQFLLINHTVLQKAYLLYEKENYSSDYLSRPYLTSERIIKLCVEHAGHDFLFTRNFHGSGFWDSGLGEYGTILTDAAHKCGEFHLAENDDGTVGSM